MSDDAPQGESAPISDQFPVLPPGSIVGDDTLPLGEPVQSQALLDYLPLFAWLLAHSGKAPALMGYFREVMSGDLESSRGGMHGIVDLVYDTWADFPLAMTMDTDQADAIVAEARVAVETAGVPWLELIGMVPAMWQLFQQIVEAIRRSRSQS